MRIKDITPRAVRVLKIQRQQNLWRSDITVASEHAFTQRGAVHESSTRTTSVPLDTAETEDQEPKIQLRPTEHRGAAEPKKTPGGGIVAELRNLDARFENPWCSGCGGKAHLAINNEGPVVICESRGCKKSERIHIQILQRLTDRLSIKCFQCKGANLSSQTGKFSNYLKCHDCNSSNSWQGVSTRIEK